MGVVVDSSVIIYAERRRWEAHRLLELLRLALPRTQLVVSAITVMELGEGIFRARTTDEMRMRETYVDEVLQAIPVIDFDRKISWRAGKIRGTEGRGGNSLPLADSLIAATALELGFDVLTRNMRDFKRIPNLRVIEF